jgi:branched-chain amino acid transport system substrate-binding protein
MKRKLSTSLVCAALAGFAGLAQAQAKISDDVVKIGVLTDLSGIYSDLSGPGSVLAARMAIEDFAKDGKVLGKPIELVSADTQNKPDVASTQARRWWDQEKVDAIVDVVATNVALAILELGKQKNKITLMSGPASLPITNENCTATNVHWMYDTYALSVGTGNALVKQGGKSWFFITADYAFGANLEKDTTAVVLANGGKVLGTIKHPFPNSSGDFSSFLLKAQASKAEVIALANAGGDVINTVKQAAEFGITSGGQKLAPLLMFLTDIHSLGLKAAQGMYLTEGFYWDQDDAARAWSQRFFERHKRMPTMIQAGVYSAVLNYLRAIQAARSDETATVMTQLKSMPIEDPVIRKGKIREDGRLVHDMLLLQVKKPSESKAPWDYYHVRAWIPGDEAFQPLSMSRCPLVKK